MATSKIPISLFFLTIDPETRMENIGKVEPKDSPQTPKPEPPKVEPAKPEAPGAKGIDDANGDAEAQFLGQMGDPNCVATVRHAGASHDHNDAWLLVLTWSKPRILRPT